MSVLSKMSLTYVLACQMLRAQACAFSPDVRTGAVVKESDRAMALPVLLISTGEPQHLGWRLDICFSGYRMSCGMEERARRRASVHAEASFLLFLFP